MRIDVHHPDGPAGRDRPQDGPTDRMIAPHRKRHDPGRNDLGIERRDLVQRRPQLIRLLDPAIPKVPDPQAGERCDAGDRVDPA